MDLDTLSRQQLQQLCKDNNIKANLKTDALITLLQSHLAAGNQLHTTRARTRSSQSAPDARPLSVPPVPTAPETSVPSPTRTRKPSRATRAPSVSVRSSIPPVSVPELVIVESEKENKKDAPRRKARESQKRLGVGKPRAAGGTGPRSVTRIVPSRSAATRTRSRVDLVEGNGQMAVVVEEDDAEDSNSTPVVPTSSAPSLSEDLQSESGLSRPGTAAVTRRISTMESQISQLFTSRDALLSKLSAQEKDILSIKDDIITERPKIIEACLAGQNAESSSQQLAETQRLLGIERERVGKLETHMGALLERIAALEERFLGGAITQDRPVDANILGIDPSTLLHPSSAHESLLVIDKKRAASSEPEGSRSKKRARQSSPPYATAALLGDALAQTNAASSTLTSLPAPVPAPPRTPPLTRNARRQLQVPPGSPRGGTPSSQFRRPPVTAPSPTTDSPRKGLPKGKGKDAPLTMMTPSKPKASAKSKAAASSSDALTVTPGASSSASKSKKPPGTNLLELMDPTASINPSASPAFPVYEPPSRFNRGLGLGLPSAGTGDPLSSSVPSGLLPPYPYGSYPSPRRHSNNSSTDTETSPGMDAEIQEPSTPLTIMEADGWGRSPDDGPPPSPDKRTLYGTEVVPDSERLKGDGKPSGRSANFPEDEDEEWM
ncbi:hypothetical protein BS47DRAFT_1379108 [Hydnum rufescens UP504]|uniref:Uncharacterized protein n=1 Tax=Hydnum rufescens UP504 TaxID=1448309 RepID=A0A9P6BAE6_9AGAM|nr:hypothetical protein BS47DRAFT_1379108 [Hydnum rufescens UP504]